MRELLAERAPRSLVAVTAVATLALGGAAIARRPQACAPVIVPSVSTPAAAPAQRAAWQPLGSSMTVDLDGDHVPEVVTMTFAEDAGRLITRVSVERLSDGSLIPVDGARMELSAPLDPAPCIGTAVAWRASSLGGGRIELTDYVRTAGTATGALPSCERGATRVFRLRGGQLVEMSPAITNVYY